MSQVLTRIVPERHVTLERPQAPLIDRDPLSELLDAFRPSLLLGGLIELRIGGGIVVPEGVAGVFVVTSGRCQVCTPSGNDFFTAGTNQLILLSSSGVQRLEVPPVFEPVELETLIANHRADSAEPISAGSGLPVAMLTGGFLRLDGGAGHPLEGLLPLAAVLQMASSPEDAWLKQLLDLVARESEAPRNGTQGIVGRLVETLFIHGLRSLLEQRGSTCGPLEALLHPEIGTTLRLIHKYPERPWTVATLAAKVDMSRSAFSAAFRDIVGQPPLHYVREARMQAACRLLEHSRLGLKEIAIRVGYDSAAAFSTAFKRWAGVAPGSFREQPHLAGRSFPAEESSISS